MCRTPTSAEQLSSEHPPEIHATGQSHARRHEQGDDCRLGKQRGWLSSLSCRFASREKTGVSTGPRRRQQPRTPVELLRRVSSWAGVVDVGAEPHPAVARECRNGCQQKKGGGSQRRYALTLNGHRPLARLPPLGLHAARPTGPARPFALSVFAFTAARSAGPSYPHTRQCTQNSRSQ